MPSGFAECPRAIDGIQCFSSMFPGNISNQTGCMMTSNARDESKQSAVQFFPPLYE